MTDQTVAPAVDESLVTEITLQPDGRIYVFGASREVLSLLADLDPHDLKLKALLAAPRCPSRGIAPPP